MDETRGNYGAAINLNFFEVGILDSTLLRSLRLCPDCHIQDVVQNIAFLPSQETCFLMTKTLNVSYTGKSVAAKTFSSFFSLPLIGPKGLRNPKNWKDTLKRNHRMYKRPRMFTQYQFVTFKRWFFVIKNPGVSPTLQMRRTVKPRKVKAENF